MKSQESAAQKTDDKSVNSAFFDFKGKLPLPQIVPLGLQHVVAAIVGIVTPALIIADVTGLSAPDRTILVQVSLVVSALATLLQLFPIFRVGAALPVIIGTSFAYLPTLKAIGMEFNLATVLGAQVVGGIAAVIMGMFLKQIRHLFPPIITGTVVFTIGLSLYPVAVGYMAGGFGSPTFGSPKNWLVAMVTLLLVIFFNQFTRGVSKLASILLGMVGGYLLALMMGMVTFGNVGTAGWMQLVSPLHFGIEFVPSAIISMVVMFIVNGVQAIGDLSATTQGGMDREATDKELAGGIMANGVASIFGAAIGGLPVATYSQNVGIVTVTRVINRAVFCFAAIVLLVAGVIPKFSAILTTIPASVIGGATISVFASIAMTGIRMISTVQITTRTIIVVGLAVAFGVGVTQVNGALSGFPAWVNTVFGASSVVLATLIAITLNLVLPKE